MVLLNVNELHSVCFYLFSRYYLIDVSGALYLVLELSLALIRLSLTEFFKTGKNTLIFFFGRFSSHQSLYR